MTSNGKQLFVATQKFLSKKLQDEGITDPKSILDKYRAPEVHDRDVVGLPAIMKAMLKSWMNTRGKANAIGNLDDLEKALFCFDHKKILKFVADTPEDEKSKKLLTEISKISRKTCEPRNKRSHWPQFSKGVISISRFLERFKNGKAFRDWVEKFYKDADTRAALPLVLQAEIHGYGFALACDFLKELGYTEFAKPDVHIIDILDGLNLCPRGTGNYLVHKRMVDLATEAGVSPYELDKFIWLIGSGRFYLHKTCGIDGKELRIRTGEGFENRKAEFICQTFRNGAIINTGSHQGHSD